MNKLKMALCVLMIVGLASHPKEATAQIPPKAKAFLVMCAYGTVGGALLGFASLAFQNNSRAIAQGASLGLYTGMAFGGYVLATHQKGGVTEEYPPQDPYQDQPPPPGFGPGDDMMGPPPGEAPPSDGGFFGVQLRVEEIHGNLASNFEPKKGTINSPPVYVPLIQMSF